MERIKTIDSTTAALKEWAIVCKALEEGRQVILLRKGRIMEYRQGFEVKHSDFFLYPTRYEHQSPTRLREQSRYCTAKRSDEQHSIYSYYRIQN
jgi:hypothetical protein